MIRVLAKDLGIALGCLAIHRHRPLDTVKSVATQRRRI